jgi:hypothetical protein
LRSGGKLLQFVELPLFTQTAAGLLDDDDLAVLQHVLNQDARAGVVIPGAGGVRKLRVAASGRGKRGGGRVLYLYIEVRSRIYLIAAYAKNEQGDITPAGYRVLARLAKELRKEK